MRTVTIPLDNPVVVGGKPLADLTMKEPTMAEEEDSMAMAVDMGRGQVPLTNEMCMYSLLCSVPYDVIRTMTSADYAKLRDAYGRFTRPTKARGRSGGTPKTNSEPCEPASSGLHEPPAGAGAN